MVLVLALGVTFLGLSAIALLVVLLSRRGAGRVRLRPPSPGALPGELPGALPYGGKPALLRDVHDADIEAQIRGGYLLDAIKLYREKTGVGPDEARSAVEAWRDRLRAS